MIYFMSGKTLITKYVVEEKAEDIFETNFVLASQRVRRGTIANNSKFREQIIDGSIGFYPDMEMILDYKDYKDPEYERKYKESLHRMLPTLALLIKAHYESDLTIVFVCAESEKKYRHLKLIRDFVREEFLGFEIYDYKKTGHIKGGDALTQNDIDILILCDDVIKDAKEEDKMRSMMTRRGRKMYVQSCTAKQLKNELKARGECYSDMSRGEMAGKLLELLEAQYNRK